MKRTLKKTTAIMLVLSLLTTLFIGCSAPDSTSEASSATNEAPAENGEVLDENVSEGATDMEMWVFVELHGEYYSDMLSRWNAEFPDKQLNINMVTYPYDDMHNKLTIAIQSGDGAPDMVDVEISKFPNYLQGEVPFFDMTSYIDPYREDIVPSRVSVYSKDGVNYGVPTHVGATVMFYNTEILESAGVDYTTIVTWDDYMEAGLKVKEAGYNMGISETSIYIPMSAMLAQQGSDFVDADGNPQVNSPEAIRALTMIQDLHEAGVTNTIAGGHSDAEEAWGLINGGEYASIIKPLWFMSRLLNYMPDLSGKIAIAPIPVFEEGMPRSVGIGGTGTVVLNDSVNPELAAEWLAWAKLTEVGNEQVWNVLGFDPVNTALWTNEELTHNPENAFVKYFSNNPFDVLNEVKDEIMEAKSTSAIPAIHNTINTITLNEVIENGVDPTEALNSAQEQIENELS